MEKLSYNFKGLWEEYGSSNNIEDIQTEEGYTTIGIIIRDSLIVKTEKIEQNKGQSKDKGKLVNDASRRKKCRNYNQLGYYRVTCK